MGGPHGGDEIEEGGGKKGTFFLAESVDEKEKSPS